MTFRETSRWLRAEEVLRPLNGVLGFAVAERPVLFLDLDKIDKNVLAPRFDGCEGPQPSNNRFFSGIKYFRDDPY
jgi:hypothetical protein